MFKTVCIAHDATLIVIKTAEFVRAYNFSKSKGKSKTKSKSKGKQKEKDKSDKEKPYRRNKKGDMLGKNGPRNTSDDVWHRGCERVDIENPSPGRIPGNIHYHGPDGEKYIFDVITGALYIYKTGEKAAPAIQRMLQDPEVQRAIDRGLRRLGEQPFFH